MLARKLAYLLHKLSALEHQMLRHGVIEAAGLAGWQLLARMLTYLVAGLWALEHQMLRPGVLEAAGLAGWDLLVRSCQSATPAGSKITLPASQACTLEDSRSLVLGPTAQFLRTLTFWSADPCQPARPAASRAPGLQPPVF